jgi:hypothetical protein
VWRQWTDTPETPERDACDRLRIKFPETIDSILKKVLHDYYIDDVGYLNTFEPECTCKESVP